MALSSTRAFASSSQPPTWTDMWDDIDGGGNLRWKVVDSDAHQSVLKTMKKHMKIKGSNQVLCPLSGDDPMVHLLWQQGHSVTAMDLVPVALERMRNQFTGGWTREDRKNGIVVWKHESGRATQYEGDALLYHEELKETFDAVYDKDSFGALNQGIREAYCSRMSQYTKEGSVVYMEVVLKDDHEESKHIGPPFSLERDDLMDSKYYGTSFKHVESLGSVYPLDMPGALQTGHILSRK